VASVLVINPNSSPSVTRSMRACLDIVARSTRHDIDCIELEKSPPGIETDAHVEMVVPNIVEALHTRPADAYVLSCFSDPGIARARAATTRPVIGIAESAYLAALGLGDRFGIVSLGPSSIARHLRYLEHLKLDGRLAGDRSIGMTIPQLMASDVVEIVTRTGRQLAEEDGAEVVILGCAGLGFYREALEATLGLPVVDPVQAGVALACTTLDLGYRMKARQ
jgi:allantoin racemase